VFVVDQILVPCNSVMQQETAENTQQPPLMLFMVILNIVKVDAKWSIKTNRSGAYFNEMGSLFSLF